MGYSQLIDESTTDVGSEKQLCVIVRFFSKLNEVIPTFLGLLSLEDGTPDAIFCA